jgi:hypothetical protein
MQFAESDFGGWADFRARWMKAEHADVPLASFQGAKFRAGVSFENRRFGGRTSFANASFAKAPIFHGGEIHQDTDFSGAEFLETTGFDAARAYRTLRLEMERWRARLEESRFFGLEQQALRQSTELTRGERVVSWLYEKTAKYGGSFLRPLVLLVATQLLAGVAFLLVYLSSSFSWDFSGSETVRFVRFWIGDLFTPFGTIRGEAGSPGGLVAIFKPSDGKLLVLGAISFARTIGTVVFLSLFLLALRRRFRIS